MISSGQSLNENLLPLLFQRNYLKQGTRNQQKEDMLPFFSFILMKNFNFFVYITALIELYYMACVCSRYNTNSDWLIVTDLWGIFLP